ncbi:hypothetical protein D3C72_2559610 [compost metagenome]
MNLEAVKTMKPRPAVAATISAATRVVQPKPMAMRMPVSTSGNAAGMITCRSTWARLAPME